MTLRLRHLRLRATTSNGLYGADIGFGPGLTVIWADNTKGKSTCMQGMLYALGMERMLSPRREIPLPHAMTSFIETDGKERHAVLESNGCVRRITASFTCTTRYEARRQAQSTSVERDERR